MTTAVTTATRGAAKWVKRSLLVLGLWASGLAADAAQKATPDFFRPPERGFVSSRPARNTDHALLIGSGTMGAMVMGAPHDETIYLNHAALYLPRKVSDKPIAMAQRLGEIRADCLAGNFEKAGALMSELRRESETGMEDSYMGAFMVNIFHPESKVRQYQRSVDLMSGEAHVAFADALGSIRRSAFVSRADDVVVLKISGNGKLSADLCFDELPAKGLRQTQEVAQRTKGFMADFKDGHLYFRCHLEPNQHNPIRGYEGLGKVVVKGGRHGVAWLGFLSSKGYRVTDADEILLLVKIRPLLKSEKTGSHASEMAEALAALPADYDALLARHAKIHGDLMGRVSFSLDAPAADRALPTEALIEASKTMDAPLAQIERVFDAGRHHIIASTGFNPPNLQGLWSPSWTAPWSADFHTDGDLPSSIAFLSPGNTPELMEPYFRLMENFLPGFRQNMKELYGMRGFYVPCSFTTSPRSTDFSTGYPLLYWHAGAAWTCRFFYDHWLHTGDRAFLEQRAYPLMKETAEFYEDFLTVTDDKGRVVFVPSYSPENAPDNGQKTHLCINAVMDVAAAKQLLRDTITAATLLGRDPEQCKKWAALIEKLPPYEVGPDGSFREWLWPGFTENNEHRHASHFYPLYDEMPPEILENPALIKAVGHSGRQRMAFHEKTGFMPFGAIHVGLAAARTADAELAQRSINHVAKNFWGNGMNPFLHVGKSFQIDASGSFPYLCSAALVYSDPGLIRFFPARPAQWKSGSIKGLRLRGAITLKELSWNGATARAILLSDKDQAVTIQTPDGKKSPLTLQAGRATVLDL